MNFSVKKASLLLVSLIFLIGALQNIQYINLDNLLEIKTYIKISIFFVFLSLSLGVFSLINLDGDFLNLFYILPIFFFLFSVTLFTDISFWSLKFLFFLFLIIPFIASYAKMLKTEETYLKIPLFSFFISINTLLALSISAIISLTFYTQIDLTPNNKTVKKYVNKIIDIAGDKALKITDKSDVNINQVDLDPYSDKKILKDLVKKYGINFQSNPAIALLNTSKTPTLNKLKEKALENTKKSMREEIYLYIESFKIPIKIFLAITIFGYLSFGLKLVSSATTLINYLFFNLLISTGFIYKEKQNKSVIRYSFNHSENTSKSNLVETQSISKITNL